LTYPYALTSEGAPDRAEPLPEELVDVDIVERRGDQVPLDLVFRNEDDVEVRLGEYFDGERPVILVLGYNRCPMLCGLVMNGVIDAIKPLEWVTGEQFRLVSVSIDPEESVRLATTKKADYLRYYGKEGAETGVHFLRGSQESIEKLASAVGFKYRYIEETNEYAHGAAMMITTPNGVISQYLMGVLHDPQTVRLALVEAADGKIGSALDRVLLFCFQYDPKAGRYTPAVMNLLKVGGVLTVGFLGAFLFALWRRDLARGAGSDAETSTESA
jgi:protein SCO1/2